MGKVVYLGMKTLILISSIFLFSCQKYKTCSCHVVNTNGLIGGVSQPDTEYDSEYNVLKNTKQCYDSENTTVGNTVVSKDTVPYSYKTISDCTIK